MNFDNLKILGSGHFSTVFKGNIDNRDVAIKLFKPQFK